MKVVDTWTHGDVYALEAMWRRVGLPELIGELVDARRLEFSVERALFALVAHRVCAPASKLHCHQRWLAEEVRIAGCEGLELQHLYRVPWTCFASTKTHWSSGCTTGWRTCSTWMWR